MTSLGTTNIRSVPTARRLARRSVRAVAVLGALSLFGAGAASGEEKQDARLPDPEPARATAPPKKKRGPRLQLKQFVTTKEREVEDARQKLIERLDGIIARTARTDADYPELLFRKGILLEERARFYFHRAMRKDDGPVPKDPAARRELERLKAEDLLLTKHARIDALKVWAQIYREFPSFKGADQALFNLASNLTEIGQGKEALRYYTDLIKRYHTSKLVPDTFLAIGEYYFDNNDAQTALKAYERVTFFKESKVYGFALYKQAWCYLNVGDYKSAMKKFIDVVRYGEGSGDQNKLDLYNEAKRELILAYSHAAGADRAPAFFTKVTTRDGDKYWEWVKPRLADTYGEQGKHADAIRLYKELIAASHGKPLAVKLQVKVVRAQIALGGRENVSREVFELIRHYKALPASADEDVRTAKKQVEQMVRELALTYHRDAVKLKSKEVYALAADLYKAHLEVFGGEPEHAYEMKFFLGELLYTLERWEQAALQYLSVVQTNPQGKHTEKAIYAAIVSFNKMLKGDTIAGSQETLKREGKVPPPQPIPPILQKMAEACELYLKVVPLDRAEKAPDVAYRLARIYYEHYHFKEAAARFELFLERYPQSSLALYAGHGLLDSLNALGDFQRLAEWGRRLLRTGAVEGQKGFRTEVEDITQGAMLKNIGKLTEDGKHREAAAAFDEFLRRYPKSPYLDKVLHNAATAFLKIAQPERAIELRERLVREFPESPLAAESMFLIGQTYHHQGVYSLAAAYYEALAQVHPSFPGADQALAAAALFREGGGEWDKAIANLESFIRKYGKDRKGKIVAEKYFRIATLYRKRGDWPRVRAQFQRFLDNFPATADQRLEALWQIAWASYKLMRSPNDKALWKLFQNVIDAYTALSAEERNALKSGREAVAQARFQQAEILFRKFQQMKLTNPKKIAKQLSAKAKALLEAGAAFYDVIRFKQAEWAIAAYSRTGQIYQGFAKALIDSPPPRNLPERLKQLYKEQVENKALEVEKNAREAYVKCLETSRELKVYTDWTKVAETQLAVLMPKEYAEANEIKIQPEFAVDPDPAPGKSPNEVMQAYRKVLENDLTNTQAMNNLGILLRRAGQWQDAITQFRRALTVDPKNVDAYRNMAWTYYTVGKYDLAHLVSVNAGRMIGKQDPGIHNNWGLVHLRRKEVARAVSAFKAAIAGNAEFAPARLNFAALALNYSDYATAEREFREALRIDPKQVAAEVGLGLALRGNRRYPEAQAGYERALQLDGTNASAHYNLAILYQEFLDKPKEAMESFSRFLANAKEGDARYRKEAETRLQNLQQLLNVLRKEGKTGLSPPAALGGARRVAHAAVP